MQAPVKNDTQRMLLLLVNKLALPVSVGSTSIILFSIIRGKFPLSNRDLAHLCIFLGCKFNDIHGHLDRIMAQAFEISQEMDSSTNDNQLEDIVSYEIQVLEFLDFNFELPNIYLKAQAIRLILDEQHIQINSEWADDCKVIDALLCEGTICLKIHSKFHENEDEQENTIKAPSNPLSRFCNEIAFASMDVDPIHCEKFGLKIDGIRALKALIN